MNHRTPILSSILAALVVAACASPDKNETKAATLREHAKDETKEAARANAKSYEQTAEAVTAKDNARVQMSQAVQAKDKARSQSVQAAQADDRARTATLREAAAPDASKPSTLVDQRTQALARLRKEVDDLSSQAERYKGIVRIDARTRVRTLRRKWSRTEAELEKAQKSSAENRREATEGFKTAQEDLTKTIAATRRWIEETVKPS